MYSAEALSSAVASFGRYAPRPRLVEVEQTANMGGGAVWPLALIEEVAQVAHSSELALHMDGARLMNAVVESGISAAAFAAPFDSAWIDLSKGLGCPMGGVLAGSAAFINEAWRAKQRMGGAMRQAGIIAAAGVYALENNVDRLSEDHDNARRLAALATACEGVRLAWGEVETNLVFLDLSATGVEAAAVVSRLEEAGINMGAMGKHTLRAVTHLDVNAAMIEEAGAALADAVNALRQ
jgi:threonine aldolase